MIPNLKLRDLVVKTAEENNIPFHLTYMERGATDGGRIQMIRSGVPSVVIGPPIRYIHSHNGILHRGDYDASVKLIVELIKKLDKKTVASLIED
jgi:putative aminopeptidase FrvX